MGMRTLFSIGIILLSIQLQAQIVDIPDAAFKQKLLTHTPTIDLNSDGEIQVSEATALTDVLDVSGTSGDPGTIANLTGLEAFINIDDLRCNFNEITSLDLSQNLNILDIRCNENPLSSVDISQNTMLRSISFSGHQLTTLDASNKPNLEFIQCNFGPLAELNLENSPNIQSMHIQSNQLAELDITSVSDLYNVTLEYNFLTELDTSQNPNLSTLRVRNNNLTTLDLSQNNNLVVMSCKANPNLNYINLKNGNNENMDIGGGFSSSNFEDLPNLNDVCLDDSNSPLATYIETQAGHSVNFTDNCSLGVVENMLDRIKMYPNPSRDIVHFEATTSIITMAVYNQLGQQVLQFAPNTKIAQIDVSSLAGGIYFVRLENAVNTISVQKLIKK